MKDRPHTLHPAIIDQLKLWEIDQNRINPKEGYLYSQFLNLSDFEKVEKYAIENSCCLFSSSRKRLLIVTMEGHQLVRTFVKANISSS